MSYFGDYFRQIRFWLGWSSISKVATLFMPWTVVATFLENNLLHWENFNCWIFKMCTNQQLLVSTWSCETWMSWVHTYIQVHASKEPRSALEAVRHCLVWKWGSEAACKVKDSFEFLIILSLKEVLPYISLIHRPPAFCHLQYGKAGRTYYIFSREHDVIDKWQKKIQNEEAKFHVLLNQLQVQCLVCITVVPPLAIYMWYVTWYLSSSCCSEPQCVHVQLSPFYHLSTLDITHVRKDTRPSV